MADKKTIKKEEKKSFPVKTAGFIAAVAAVIIAAVLIIVLVVRGVPGDIKAEVQAKAISSLRCSEVKSLSCEKKFEPENSDRKLYLISGDLVSKAGGNKWLNGGYVLALASVTNENGEENIDVSIVKGYKKNEKEAFSQDLKNLKNSTAEWQAKIEESIR